MHKVSPKEAARIAYNMTRSIMGPFYKSHVEALLNVTRKQVKVLDLCPNVQQFRGTFAFSDQSLFKDVFRHGPCHLPGLICTYVITNTVTGHVWPGSTEDFWRRWYKHLWLARKGSHTNYVLQDEFDTYGEAAFTIEIHETFGSTDGLLEYEEALGLSFAPKLVKSMIVGNKRLNGYSSVKATRKSRRLPARAKRGANTVARWFDFQSVQS